MPIGANSAVVALASLVAAFAWSVLPAAAQQTLSRPEPLTLPDGREATAAILRHDGILFADRLQFVVMDRDRRVIAQSAEGYGHALSCDRQRRVCQFYDHDGDLVLGLDPTGFRTDGPMVPEVRDYENLHAFQNGEWGFRSRPATTLEWISAESALIRANWIGFGLLAIAGAMCATAAFTGLGFWKKAGFWRISAWALGILARLVGVAALLVVSLYMSLLSGVCGSFFFTGLACGVAIYWIARRLSGRRPTAA